MSNEERRAMNTRRVRIWPDEEWVFEDEYDEVQDQWKGDDYLTVEVPERWEMDQIYILAALYVGNWERYLK